jgi:hypothetical protein
LRRLDSRDREAPLGKGQCYMPDAGAQIAHAMAVDSGQICESINELRWVRGPRIVDVRHAVEDPTRGFVEANLSTTEAHSDGTLALLIQILPSPSLLRSSPAASLLG